MTANERDEYEDADEQTTAPAAPPASPAAAPHDADVVRLCVNVPGATAISCAAGSANVTDGCIEVPSADADRWVDASNGVVTRT